MLLRQELQVARQAAGQREDEEDGEREPPEDAVHAPILPRAGTAAQPGAIGSAGIDHHGFWDVLEAEPPRHLLVSDGFADDTGAAVEGMPATRMRVSIVDRPSGGVTVSITSEFPSLEAMQQLEEMGMDEGLRAAMGQIDAILAG